ncbi:MAG: hypothetical protein ACLSAO_03470 [Anaerovoracaceae bacterium]
MGEASQDTFVEVYGNLVLRYFLYYKKSPDSRDWNPGPHECDFLGSCVVKMGLRLKLQPSFTSGNANSELSCNLFSIVILSRRWSPHIKVLRHMPLSGMHVTADIPLRSYSIAYKSQGQVLQKKDAILKDNIFKKFLFSVCCNYVAIKLQTRTGSVLFCKFHKL